MKKKEYGERLTKITRNLSNDPLVTIEELINLVRELIEENQRLKTEVRQLKDEIASLKNQPPRPKITPSKLEKNPDGSSIQQRNWIKGPKNHKLVIDRTEKVELSPDQIPQGSVFKGYKPYIVQELIIKKETICFQCAQWQRSDGTYICAKLPTGIEGHHFGPTLRKYIINQYHANRVTQNRIKADLQDQGFEISTGQINAILEEMAEKLKAEKEGLLAAGLKADFFQADDTGARHKKENGVATVICNDFFTYIKSTPSKSRINFLEVLCDSRIEYTITAEALDYIKNYNPAELTMDKLRALLGKTPKNKDEWNAFLKEHLFGQNTRRTLTEGALIGTLMLREMLTPEMIFMSDGAGQFNLFKHVLCWIHVERSIKKLIPINKNDRLERDAILEKFWTFYRDLKAYKEAPTEEQKAALAARFDEIFSFRAKDSKLLQVLKKIRDQKAQLLLVLEHPKIPLHNNTSERDIREYVTRRKISGGTRSDAGRDARDTFTSLYKTCKKLGIKFGQFLDDRLNNTNLIPSLADLVRKKIEGAIPGP